MFHHKRIHSVVVIVVLVSVLSLIAGASWSGAAKSLAPQQGPLDFMQTLDYPDAQPVRVYGRISVALTASGSNTKDKTKTEVDVAARGSMNFDRTGATYEAGARGLITGTTPPDPNDECKKATVQTWRWDGSNSQRQDGDDGKFTLSASKQKGLAHFEPGGIIGELNQIMVHQTISTCTTQDLGDNPLAGINYRMPLHGAGTTPFTVAANRIEGEGKSGNQVLIVNPLHTGTIEGIIESTWDGNGTSGKFDVEMLARVVGGGVEWNTPAAWRAMSKDMDGPSIATDPELFYKGRLEITWSLTRAQR